jgi:ABC-type sugar transport system substrate-binding protein
MPIKGENGMSDDFFDFGFTAVDETELQAVQDAQKAVGDVEVTATVTQDKLDKLYNAIVPLLNNLKKNPEKEYILWPNRIEKVELFESYLYKIYSE